MLLSCSGTASVLCSPTTKLSDVVSFFCNSTKRSEQRERPWYENIPFTCISHGYYQVKILASSRIRALPEICTSPCTCAFPEMRTSPYACNARLLVLLLHNTYSYSS